MYLKTSALVVSTLFVAASCGGGSTSSPTLVTVSASPTVPSAPESDADLAPEPTEEYVPFCGAEVPTGGPSIADIRSGLAAFKAPDADTIALANTYTFYPDFPVPDGAILTGFSTTMTDEGGDEISFSTSISHRVTDTNEMIIERYTTYAEEQGWTIEVDEVTPTLTIIDLDAPEFTETEAKLKVTFSPAFGGKTTGGLDVQYSATGPTSELGDPTRWHQWHTEELPYVEGACYRGGGAATNISHPESSTTFGGPGDNMSVDLAYVDTTQEDFIAGMTANAEGAGFTIEPGNVDGTFDLVQPDRTIGYQVTPADSINGVLVTASANYPGA